MGSAHHTNAYNDAYRVSLALAMLVFQTSRAEIVTFNAEVTNQAIDGFGGNINYRGWNNDE